MPIHLVHMLMIHFILADPLEAEAISTAFFGGEQGTKPEAGGHP